MLIYVKNYFAMSIFFRIFAARKFTKMKEDEMKKIAEAKILEEEALKAAADKRIAKWRRIIEAIDWDGESERVLSNDVPKYPNYPFEGTLLEKIQYWEDMYGTVWQNKKMKQWIEDAEGKGTPSANNLSQRITQFIKKGQMYSMKINGSNKYTFFFTRKDWVQTDDTGNKPHHTLIPSHMANEDDLKKLTDNQRSNISFHGDGYD